MQARRLQGCLAAPRQQLIKLKEHANVSPHYPFRDNPKFPPLLERFEVIR